MDSDVASDDSTVHSDAESAREMEKAATETPQPQERLNAVTSQIMRIFLEHKSKKYALRRYLQLSIGPRQSVIWAMTQMTFQDFCKYTHTHPCDILYDLEKCHHYVTVKPGIWPPNLYICLKDLKKYLSTKGIILHKLDLRCVPPVFLHWCDLMKVTNFDQCVQYDYYKATGKNRMTGECLRSRREEFYHRCWEAGEWVWQAPVITDSRLLLQESSISATPKKSVNNEQQAKGHDETNAAAMNTTALGTCEAARQQLPEDVVMDVPEDLVSAPDASPSVPSQSRMQSETLLDASVASPTVDGAAGSSQQPLAETGSPAVTSQPAEVASCQAQGYIIGAGAHLHSDIIMRSIKARVSDTSKHAEILERIQKAILRHQRSTENEHEAAEETGERERHGEVAQQSSANVQQETNRELRGESQPPLTAKLAEVPVGTTEQTSLHYHLRMAYGPKHHIIWAILQMTFAEFLQYTRIYPHETLLGDLRTAEDWHRSAVCVSGSWPENLYIRLADLKEYLHCKGLLLHKMDLRCVTPIVLHWSDLMQSTNFDQCVQYDYFKETGQRRMSGGTLRQRREAFYRRCCIAGDWLWRPPTVTDAAVLQQFAMPEGEHGQRHSDVGEDSPKPSSSQQTTDPSPNNTAMPQLRDPTLSSADPTVASPQQSDITSNSSNRSMQLSVQINEHQIPADEACDTSLNTSTPFLPSAESILINTSQGSLLLTPTIRGQPDTIRPTPKNNSPIEAQHTDSTQCNERSLLSTPTIRGQSDPIRTPSKNNSPIQAQHTDSTIQQSNEEATTSSNATLLEAGQELRNFSGTTDSDICNETSCPSPIDERTDSLHYHVRMAIGPKQAIIWAMQQMSFDEFQQYTHFHRRDRGQRGNTKMWEAIYELVTRKPGIWPPGLYIRLADLKEYLQRKEVLLHQWDLRCVSPIFLHWSDLLATTNFDQCVLYYHYKTEGSTRLPVALMPKKRNQFYFRCWKAGEWLWRTPHVTDPQLRQQILEANDLKSPSRAQHTSDFGEKPTAAADPPKRPAPLNDFPSRQGCDLATIPEHSTNESEQNPATNLSGRTPEGIEDSKDSNAGTKVRKQRKLPEGFLRPVGAPTGRAPKKRPTGAKKKIIETFVPQLTHQYKPLPVNVVKKKDPPIANVNVLADISNNNAVEATPITETTSDWTPSQAFAADNTLFNASALVRVADQATDGNSEPASTSLPPRAAPQVIECLNPHSRVQPDVSLRVETEIFFHEMQCFDYYHALTYDQIQRDLLYETEIGKRYVQAQINYGGRRTKVYGDFLAALFASCSRELLADFQYVLASLGEYHYRVYKKREQVDEDQRRSVLHSFLKTRPVVSRCRLRFDSATREYAKAHRVVGYASQGEAPARKRPLAKAIKPHILEEIKLLKAKLARE